GGPDGGGEVGALDKLADVIHTGVGGGVDLDQVGGDVAGGGEAVGALVAGFFALGGGAVGGPGEEAGGAGLADAAGAGERVGMRDPAGGDGVLERAHDGLLADKLVKGLRAVLAIEGRRGLHGLPGGGEGCAETAARSL